MGDTAINVLRSVLRGEAFTANDEGYNPGRATWDLAVEHRPAVVVMPEEPGDVLAAVRYARLQGLPVAAQATGHGPIFGCDGGVLINTSRMKQVRVDPETQTARVDAGVVWREVLNAAHPYGLAGLSGTSPGVGVVGYTLGGGTGWLARRYGYACDSLIAAEAVTGDGRLVRTSERENADLFWALRGGGGGFGVVTALEFRLYPVAQVYGGGLYFPAERAREVFAAYLEWTAGLPDSVTSTLCIQHVPDAPFVPEPVRGRSFIIAQGAILGTEAEACEILRPMRQLGPAMDAFGMMPYREAGKIAAEPEDPLWAQTGTETMKDIPCSLADDIVDEVADRRTTSLTIVAFRHIQGAYAKRPESSCAVSRPDAKFLMVSIGIGFAPHARETIAADTATLRSLCRPYSAGVPVFNFVGWAGRERDVFSDDKYDRLAAIKDRYDPHHLFRFAMPVSRRQAAAA